MKIIKLLMFIIFCFFAEYSVGQKTFNAPPRKKDTSFVLPKFIDSNLFRSSLENKLDFKSMFDAFRRDTVLGNYMYTFDINEYGKVEPRLYYDKNTIETKQIQQFVEDVFNKYNWQAGYKKKCTSCKAKIYLQLLIFFEVDNKDFFNTEKSFVEVEIQDMETLKTLFQISIPYKELKDYHH